MSNRYFSLSPLSLLFLIAIIGLVLYGIYIAIFSPADSEEISSVLSSIDASISESEEADNSDNTSATDTVDSGDSSDSSPASSDTADDAEPAMSVPAAQLDESRFSSENGRIYYDSDSVAYGIDVSNFQGEIDWEQVAEDGVGFAMIRAGLRGYETPNLVEDTMCRDNIAAALDAGIEVGLYFHSQAITDEEAREEASFLIDIAEDFDITYPLAIDWERSAADSSRTKDISGDDATAFCAVFCEEIQEAGYTPAFYFNPTDSSSDLNADELSDYIFWMAQYDSAIPDLEYGLHIWQYSNTGTVSGINGDVDLNICFYDLSLKKGTAND